jgi:hypothetical protein
MVIFKQPLPSRRDRLAILLVFLVAFALPGLSATSHTDFSGTWKVDTGKSDFGRIPAPGQMTDTISQNDHVLTINRERDGQPVKLQIPLDGSTLDNKLRGVPVKTTAEWQEATLVVRSSGQHFGGSVGYEEHWSLSADGKVLTIKRTLNGPQGETGQTVVYAKQ